jgi:hypothetical protein
MANLKDEVHSSLQKQGASDEALELWNKVYSSYEQGGSDAVWDLLEKKVKEIRKAARAEAAEMKSAAGVVKSKKLARKRR